MLGHCGHLAAPHMIPRQWCISQICVAVSTLLAFQYIWWQYPSLSQLLHRNTMGIQPTPSVAMLA